MKENLQDTTATLSLVLMGSLLMVAFFVIRSIFSFSFISLKMKNKFLGR
jgi:hypothetical protein